MKRTLGVLLILILIIPVTGCLNNYLVGSQMWDKGKPEIILAEYRAPLCIGKNKTYDGPVATYYLTVVKEKMVLIEMEDNGRGVSITNHWRGEDGFDHFLTYVKGEKAWYYKISSDRKAALRFVYNKNRYQKKIVNGVHKITGKPFAVCKLIPVKFLKRK